MNCDNCMENGRCVKMELDDVDSDDEMFVYETYHCPVCNSFITICKEI